jgi:serine/threonine protein kinase
MLTAGTLIDGKYEVERVLGAGGFGTVYGAVQPQLGRTVAVKVVSTTLLHEADGLARFEREAKAISSLNHKNIVQFYGYGTWQQAPYMVMELVAGTSLEEILRGGRSIEPMRALRLIHQLFEALGAAHEVGVIHRDLKPSNILVQNSELGETLKIIDFGLAKLMPGYGIPGQKLTETGYALGTCAYMPPEQALGLPVTERADIYSAGCILYQMLSGRQPFEADNNVAMMYQHINEQPQPLKNRLPTGAPVEALTTFINNCMAKEQKARYPTCVDALEDIDAICQGNFNKVKSCAAHQLKQLAPQRSKPSLRLVVAISAGITTLLAAAVFGVYSYALSNDDATNAVAQALSGVRLYDMEAALLDSRADRIATRNHLPPATSRDTKQLPLEVQQKVVRYFKFKIDAAVARSHVQPELANEQLDSLLKDLLDFTNAEKSAGMIFMDLDVYDQLLLEMDRLVYHLPGIHQQHLDVETMKLIARVGKQQTVRGLWGPSPVLVPKAVQMHETLLRLNPPPRILAGVYDDLSRLYLRLAYETEHGVTKAAFLRRSEKFRDKSIDAYRQMDNHSAWIGACAAREGAIEYVRGDKIKAARLIQWDLKKFLARPSRATDPETDDTLFASMVRQDFALIGNDAVKWVWPLLKDAPGRDQL